MPALVPPETTLALSPRRLRALLAAAGAPRPLLAKPPLAIARSLFEDDHTPPVVAALTAVDRFARGVGPDALEEGATLARYPISAGATAEGAADVAAEAVITSLAKGATALAAQRAMSRAAIRTDRFFIPRASYELGGSPPAQGARKGGDRAHATFVREVERLLRGWLGDAFRALWSALDPEGRAHFGILYAAKPSSLVSWPPGAASPVRGLASAVLADVVRIDDRDQRILLTPARESHLVPLARAFGSARHGDPDHYALGPAFSFRLLQALGAHGFARRAKPAGVRAWSVVGCEWDSGYEERIEARSEDALLSLEARTSFDGGYFPRVTLRIIPDEGPPLDGAARGKARLVNATTSVDLFIQLPHRITVSDPRYEPIARAAGKALGMFEPGALLDDIRTLAPWTHFEWRWRSVLGDEAFELLVRRKLLLRVKAKKGVASPAHRSHGSSAKLTPIPGEELQLATPRDFSLPAFEVEETDADAWRLDVTALERHLGQTMGLRRWRETTTE